MATCRAVSAHRILAGEAGCLQRWPGCPRAAAAAVARLRDVMRRAEAIRDLPGCVLVSTSRPCRMCEATACWTGIARTVYGEALTDAGPPR